jgi:hypothetical protein
MKLQKICSGNVKVVPSGTAYDAAVYREITEPTTAPVVELKIEKKKRKGK